MSEGSDCEIVVSGISGRFPNADNMRELSHCLYNKVDMIDDQETRWKHFNDIVPRRSGKIRNIEHFDSKSFNLSQRSAKSYEPQMRMLSEHCYEAIIDAGVNPNSLHDRKIGVFVGCSATDSKESEIYYHQHTEGNIVL